MELLASDENIARQYIVEFTGMDPQMAQKVVISDWSSPLTSEALQEIMDRMRNHSLLQKDLNIKDLLLDSN